VLFTSSAGLGHIHPTIPLARAALRAGDEVLFAVAAEAVPTVQSFGFAAVPISYGDPADIGRAWANLPDRDLNTYVVAEIFTRVQGLAALPAQQATIRDFRADLVVSGEISAHVAAEACGVPSAFLAITALDLDDLKWETVVAATNDLRAAAGLSPTAQLPYEAGIGYLSPVPPLLWNDPSRLPADAIWYRHEDAEDDSTSSPDPGAQGPQLRPRVYATLGSMAGANDFGRPVFAAMLAALGRLDADVLFTTGPFDPAALGPPPANVTVAAYEPQSRAMRCDAAVIHAGAGTTVAALARGLPLVAVPMFADQSHNADRLVAAQVAVRVDPDEVGERLVAAVNTVLDEPAYAASARRVAEAIATRPSPGQAIDLLRDGVRRRPGS
jgi:UDP:flavonoid glycosyltransferase YjiC (YdhE family)